MREQLSTEVAAENLARAVEDWWACAEETSLPATPLLRGWWLVSIGDGIDEDGDAVVVTAHQYAGGVLERIALGHVMAKKAAGLL